MIFNGNGVASLAADCKGLERKSIFSKIECIHIANHLNFLTKISLIPPPPAGQDPFHPCQRTGTFPAVCQRVLSHFPPPFDGEGSAKFCGTAAKVGTCFFLSFVTLILT